MTSLVSFDAPMESLVQFVEDTAPDDIVEATYRRLQDGEASARLLKAAGLAVSRSTELPASHHGGPVHPVAGLYAISRLSARLSGPDSYLPTIQSIALANKHIHAPEMGPGAMPKIDIGALADADIDTLLGGFETALTRRATPSAERHLIALLDRATPGQVMEVLLRVALPRNALDDHYFLYMVYAFRALDDIGWDHAEVLLRPTVRFLTRHPMMEPGEGIRGKIISDGIDLYRNHGDLARLIDDRGLDSETRRYDTGPDETDPIDALADRIAAIESIPSIAEPLADAMAGGLSVMGACEAASIGGARRYLRSCSGNPFDVHIHTGINARRYLLAMPGLLRRTQLLVLLTWCQGYEVRHIDRTLTWSPPAPAATPRDAQTLLDLIADSITGQPEVDLSQLTGSIADLVAPNSVQDCAALAREYADAGYDAAPFFARLAELVCRDDQSEMHAYKLQQAAYEEYLATREPLRRVHMVAAAKHLAGITELRPQTVYPRAMALAGATAG